MATGAPQRGRTRAAGAGPAAVLPRGAGDAVAPSWMPPIWAAACKYMAIDSVVLDHAAGRTVAVEQIQRKGGKQPHLRFCAFCQKVVLQGCLEWVMMNMQEDQGWIDTTLPTSPVVSMTWWTHNQQNGKSYNQQLCASKNQVSHLDSPRMK
jgi:hypothetical protein